MIFYRTALVPAVVFALAAIVLPSLSGCASSNGAGGRAKDLHTQSDDTEVRKRARIRLELATTYYLKGSFLRLWMSSSRPLPLTPHCLQCMNCVG